MDTDISRQQLYITFILQETHKVLRIYPHLTKFPGILVAVRNNLKLQFYDNSLNAILIAVKNNLKLELDYILENRLAHMLELELMNFLENGIYKEFCHLPGIQRFDHILYYDIPNFNPKKQHPNLFFWINHKVNDLRKQFIINSSTKFCCQCKIYILIHAYNNYYEYISFCDYDYIQEKTNYAYIKPVDV